MPTTNGYQKTQKSNKAKKKKKGEHFMYQHNTLYQNTGNYEMVPNQKEESNVANYAGS